MKKVSLLRQAAQEQVDSAQSSVFVCTPEFEFAYCNQAWLNYRHSELEAEQGRKLTDVLHPDVVATVKDALTATMRHREPTLVEARIANGCGEYHWFRIIVEPLCNAKKSVIGCMGYARPIGEQKAEKNRLLAEAELQRAHDNILSILREIPTPICVVSENSATILTCNAAFAVMCAGTEQGMADVPVLQHFLGLDGVDRNFGEVLMQRFHQRESFVCRLGKCNGTFATVETMARPFVFNEQQAFAVHCLDLSTRKAQEQALREAVLASEEASKMKSTFLANMSHEIRTPLNGVIGFAELALDEPNLSESVESCLNRIKISANGLLDIINDVLDISKIEAGKIELEHLPFDLHVDIMQPCETIIGSRAKEKDVVLYLYAEPVIARKLVGDPTRLRQILFNLLSNAVKFTNVGIVKLMLSVKEVTDTRCLISFEIKDSGIGMTPEQVSKVFAPFIQADSSTTRKYGGTGLGLAITKNLIEIMGGTLVVESALGIGSKFTFALPFDTIADDSHLAPKSASGPIQRKKPRFHGDVLICEDNIINQQVIQEHLARLGLQVTVMPNGKQGVDQVKHRFKEGRHFDLIFMDIHMPVMDGLEATQILRGMGVKSIIVALTANAMSTDRERYLSQGMDDYLAKPFKAYDLWDCLARHLTPDEPPLGLVVTSMPAADARLQSLTGDSRIPSSVASAVLVVPVGASGGVTVTAVQEPRTAAMRAGVSLDKELGIENAAGDPALYRKLVLNFVGDNRNANVYLCDALDSGNITLAHRLAHTLKSVAATIGAMKLSAIAADMENRLNDGQLDSVRRLQPDFAAELETVLRELSYLQTKEDSCGGNGALDKAKARAVLDTLEPLLRKADSEALNFLDAIEDALFPVGEKGQTLFTQIDDYDFEPALATLIDIRDDLEQNND